MIGSIIGDICGSTYEYKKFKENEINLFHEKSKFTDDTILTMAVAECLIKNKTKEKDFKEAILHYAIKYPKRGYGSRFYEWLKDPKEPYNSFGNGSAMRISSIPLVSTNIVDVMNLSYNSSVISHNHPEGIKGAKAIAAATFFAKEGLSKKEIKEKIESIFNYDLNRSLKEIKKDYKFNAICQTTVPESIIAFLESTDFESTIYNAISLGGDTDTLACMAGGIAESYYGIENIPQKFINQAKILLPDEFKDIINLTYRKIII